MSWLASVEMPSVSPKCPPARFTHAAEASLKPSANYSSLESRETNSADSISGAGAAQKMPSTRGESRGEGGMRRDSGCHRTVDYGMPECLLRARLAKGKRRPPTDCQTQTIFLRASINPCNNNNWLERSQTTTLPASCECFVPTPTSYHFYLPCKQHRQLAGALERFVCLATARLRWSESFDSHSRRSSPSSARHTRAESSRSDASCANRADYECECVARLLRTTPLGALRSLFVFIAFVVLAQVIRAEALVTQVFLTSFAL